MLTVARVTMPDGARWPGARRAEPTPVRRLLLRLQLRHACPHVGGEVRLCVRPGFGRAEIPVRPGFEHIHHETVSCVLFLNRARPSERADRILSEDLVGKRIRRAI